MTTQQSKKWIFIDLDNTLYNYEPCNNHANTILTEHLNTNHSITEANLATARKQVKNQIPNTAASHSRLLYIAQAIENKYGKSDPELSLKLHDIFWRAYFTQLTPNKDIIQFITSAKREQYNIGIITNLTTEIQYKKIIHLGIQHLIDLIITSEQAGVEKPHATIYSYACQRAQCNPKDAIMIGDDEHDDIEGATKIGMKAININSITDWQSFEQNILDNIEQPKNQG